MSLTRCTSAKMDTYLGGFLVELLCGDLELVDVLLQVRKLRLHLPQLHRQINQLAFELR